MQVTARVDYALRAMVELSARHRAGEPAVKGLGISEAQGIPKKFMENILLDLKHDGLVRTQRGVGGGYKLARPAEEISLADVIRAVEGPLANVRGEWPEEVSYDGAAEPLYEVWIALRASMRSVLENVTLEDVARGELPGSVIELTRDQAAWRHH